MPVTSAPDQGQLPADDTPSAPSSTPLSQSSPDTPAVSGQPPQSKTLKHPKNKYTNSSPPPPTNCIVLKNLDYNITQLALEEVVRRVTGGRKEFVNVALIDDKQTGSFRGMAFVNFHSIADATAALSELSKMVINKRKVIAEYRRLRPGEKVKDAYEKRAANRYDHFNGNRQTFEKDITAETDENGNAVDKRAAFFAKRDTIRKVDEQKQADEKAARDKEREAEFRSMLLEYDNANVAEDEPIEDLVFDVSLTSHERKMIHNICNGLGLGHLSRFDDDGNRVLHVTKDPERKAEWKAVAAEQKAEMAAAKKAEAQKRKNKDSARNGSEWKKVEPTTGGAVTKEELQGIKWFKPRAAKAAEANSKEDENVESGIRAPSYKLYIPPRQPTGPDGTVGFKSRSHVRNTEGDGKDSVATSDEPHEQDSQLNEKGDAGEETEEGGQWKQAENAEPEEGRRSATTVLNPSVPAFSPSFTQSY